MPTQLSTDWIHAYESNQEWILMSGGGPRLITRSLPEPRRQRPSVVLMIGGPSKTSSLRYMSTQKKRHPLTQAMATLSLDLTTRDHEFPTLFANIDLDNVYSGHYPRGKCLGLARHRVEWCGPPEPLSKLVDVALGKLIFLFADVVCLFLDDFPSIEDGYDSLQRWIIANSNTGLWKPRVLVLTHQRPSNLPQLHSQGGFHQITVVPMGRLSNVKKAIMANVDKVRIDRRDSLSLFSAAHLQTFFEAALKHTAYSVTERFNFIRETRQHNIVREDFSRHIEHFAGLCSSHEVSSEIVRTHIASAMLLDCCPPEMHFFEPQEVFRTVYSDSGLDGVRSKYMEDKESQGSWQSQLRQLFCTMYQEFLSSDISAKCMHEKCIRSLPVNWKSLKTTLICLFCLKRRPEHMLTCGHGLCDVCTSMTGRKGNQMEYTFVISQCPLCQASVELSVHLKPPTAGARLLILDGGGIRGVFTLHALKAIEEARKLPYPIYDEFDLSLGTSTGGLIVLMFYLRHSLEDCMSIFHRLAKRVFWPSLCGNGSFFTRVRNLMASILTDSLYGAKIMESCVKEAYGDTVLFGSAGAISGAKVAVTAMTVADSRLCILSNYNGRHPRKGYIHHRTISAADEILVREAARATSAAPSYFPAKFIRGRGFLQDGGAGKHNNPIDPAEWESKAIWDSSTDIAISIGTGYLKSPNTPTTFSERLKFKDRFLARLVRLFNAVISGQAGWNDHLNRVREEDRGRYFRINMPLEKEPELDDVSKMIQIEQWSWSYLRGYNFVAITQAMFAVSFYFELDQLPPVESDEFLCRGQIRCRSPDPQALLQRVLKEYPSAYFVTDGGLRLGYLAKCSYCSSCQLYHLDVAPRAYDMQQKISLYLQFNVRSKRKIGGFPQTMESIARKQGLYAQFGRLDHRSVNAAIAHVARANRKRKRCYASKKERNISSKKKRLID